VVVVEVVVAMTHTALTILEQALAAIADRAPVRDCDGVRSMRRTVVTFNNLTGNELSERDGWIFMLCVKLSRSQQGNFHVDDYVDLAGFAALAGEAEYAEAYPTREGSIWEKDQSIT